MVRDAEATKKKLLEAAAAEFAAYGIAGARVDRIAEAAGCNKAMIYAYYGNKDQLFDAVFTGHVSDTVEQVPIDPADLPEYAGRLFDRYEDNPAIQRLATWYQLERPDGEPLRAVVSANRDKLDEIGRAQREGTLPDHYTPVELLALVLSISRLWAWSGPVLGMTPPDDRAARRRTVVDAVRRLLAR